MTALVSKRRLRRIYLESILTEKAIRAIENRSRKQIEDLSERELEAWGKYLFRWGSAVGGRRPQ